MAINKTGSLLSVKSSRIIVLFIVFFGLSVYAAFLASNFRRRVSPLGNVLRIPTSTIQTAKNPTNASLPTWDSGSLWSMPLADDHHFRLARLLPCRTVEYTSGLRNDKIDSCDHASTNEFSVENSVHAQTWLFEYQNPVDCSNRKIAIIHNFAASGFGSTMHQVVWAFGEALAKNRIAVYVARGNWVR